MISSVAAYQSTLVALITAGALVLFQLIVADIAAIRAKHKAGTPIPPDFSRFYFRAARAHANTNESISSFLAFAVVGMLAGVIPSVLGSLAWLYIACRTGHMLAYYANHKLLRSTAFGLSLVVLVAMLYVGLSAVLAR